MRPSLFFRIPLDDFRSQNWESFSRVHKISSQNKTKNPYLTLVTMFGSMKMKQKRFCSVHYFCMWSLLQVKILMYWCRVLFSFLTSTMPWMCNIFPCHIHLSDYKVRLTTRTNHTATSAMVWISDEMLPICSTFFAVESLIFSGEWLRFWVFFGFEVFF